MFVCSMGIQSVADDGTSGLLNQAMCSACEMAAVWMESELTQNQTQERILAYAAEVSFERAVKLYFGHKHVKTLIFVKSV